MASEADNEVNSTEAVERTYTAFLIDGKSFAVDVDSVKEIVKLKGLIPLEEPFEDVLGFIELHSVRIPVLNTKKILKFKSSAIEGGVMIVNIDGYIFGFMVDIDADLEVFSSIFKPKTLKGKPPFNAFVEGALEYLGKTTYILSLPSLLTKKTRERLLAHG